MLRVGRALVLTGVMLIMGALLWIALPASVRVAKTQFVPGSRVVIHIGRLTLEGTLVKTQGVNRAHKADRLKITPAQAKVPPYHGPYVIEQSAIL